MTYDWPTCLVYCNLITTSSLVFVCLCVCILPTAHTIQQRCLVFWQSNANNVPKREAFTGDPAAKPDENRSRCFGTPRQAARTDVCLTERQRPVNATNCQPESTMASDDLLKTLRKYDVALEPRAIASAFEDREQGTLLSEWVKSRLTPDTLLTKDELNSYGP